MLVPRSLHYCNFVVSFENGKCKPADFVLFQDCFGVFLSHTLLFICMCFNVVLLRIGHLRLYIGAAPLSLGFVVGLFV